MNRCWNAGTHDELITNIGNVVNFIIRKAVENAKDGKFYFDWDDRIEELISWDDWGNCFHLILDEMINRDEVKEIEPDDRSDEFTIVINEEHLGAAGEKLEVIDMVLSITKKPAGQQRGICPKCGSDELDYGDEESFDGEIRQNWQCDNCGAAGLEVCELEFVEHRMD